MEFLEGWGVRDLKNLLLAGYVYFLEQSRNKTEN